MMSEKRYMVRLSNKSNSFLVISDLYDWYFLTKEVLDSVDNNIIEAWIGTKTELAEIAGGVFLKRKPCLSPMQNEVEYETNELINTQLTERNSTKGALIDQTNHETIRLSFVKQGKNYLVNNLERVLLTTLGGTSQGNSYGSPDDSEEEDSSEETTIITGGL